MFQNGSSEVSECASTSSVGSNSSHSKAPGSQLTHKPIAFPRPSTIATRELTKQLIAIENDPTLGILSFFLIYNYLGSTFNFSHHIFALVQLESYKKVFTLQTMG